MASKLLSFIIILCISYSHATYSQKAEAYLTSNSDLLIIGTVNDMKDTPEPASEMFHSLVTIQIDNILKGKINTKSLIIRLQYGPVIDSINGGYGIAVSIEPQFTIKEKVVLFLKNKEKEPFLNSPYVKKSFKTFDGNSSISDLPVNTYWISGNRVFEVKNGAVNYYGKLYTLHEFIKSITKSEKYFNNNKL